MTGSLRGVANLRLDDSRRDAVPSVSGQTFQDGIGDEHGLVRLLAINVRLSVVLHAIDELRQFLREGVGAGGIHWQCLDGNEVAENVFLELFNVGTRLAGHVERSRSESQGVRWREPRHFPSVHVASDTTAG